MTARVSGAAPVIGIVAGEASGDLLGAQLVTALHSRRPDLRFEGVAGRRMVAAGVNALFPAEKLAVRGYVEVMRHYREITGIRRDLAAHFVRQPPALFIGIDAPDFNLDLELRLRAAGIRTVHYVSPSIWAWRGGRINKIRRAVDHMLVVFPFEKGIYDRAGIAASYVGHPLADMLADCISGKAARVNLGLDQNACVVGLLPGSRLSELEEMAELFVEAALKIAAARPGTLFISPLVSHETRAILEAALARHPALHVMLLDGHSHEAMAASDVLLVASGTATLEAALLCKPMVIAYRMPRLSWWLINSRRYQPWVGLPNILAREFVVPELLQDEATPERLAGAVLDLMDDAERRLRITARFEQMRKELRCNAAERAAEVILPFLAAPPA